MLPIIGSFVQFSCPVVVMVALFGLLMMIVSFMVTYSLSNFSTIIFKEELIVFINNYYRNH
jgi:hypothetical protein